MGVYAHRFIEIMAGAIDEFSNTVVFSKVRGVYFCVQSGCVYRSTRPRALKKGSVYKASESGVFKQLCEKFDFPSDFRFSWGCFCRW